MLKKIIVSLCLLPALLLVGCHGKKEAANEIKVGTISGPETNLMEVAKSVAKNCYGLDVDIVVFSDYNIPNAALQDDSIGANMFQHVPYLNAQNKARGYHLVSVGKTFVYPMGVYSNKIKNLADLKDGAKVAIPNDPTNEARALLLLQKAKLIELKPNATVLATPSDILKNPKHLNFVALNAAMLPRALHDVSIAVINTTFAIPAGLHPTSALYAEGPDSPYANVVVTRPADKNSIKVKELLAALHSKEVLATAQRIFGDAAIPAWNQKQPLLPCKKAD
jgi:D-methionine transport system substrate-binding protein